MEALLEGDGPQDLGRDGAGQHVDVPHGGGGGVRVLLLPALEHPPAQQRSQLVPSEHPPLATDTHTKSNRHTHTAKSREQTVSSDITLMLCVYSRVEPESLCQQKVSY